MGRLASCYHVAVLTLTLTSTSFALDVPVLTGRVVDLAQVLSADRTANLAQELEAHEVRTSNQVAVLILPSLEGEPLEEFSHRVSTTWKLGQRGTNNGVLLLVALRERQVRIEVGYGLEGALTDLRASRIIRNEIVPRFRAGDLPGGIAGGVCAILATIEGTYSAAEAPQSQPRRVDEPTAVQYVTIGIIVGTLVGLMLSHGLLRTRALFGALLAFLVAQSASILLGLVAAGVTTFLLWLLLQAARGGARRGGWGPDLTWGPGSGWGGGSFGGDIGFSGGGGDFGGGGASGRW